MEEDIKTLGDYLAILRRRKWRIVVTAALLSLISIGVAFVMPPVYRSTATILIEEQEIPQDLVRSTVTSFADQRIQIISQRVMTRANLQRIVDQFNLYPDERNKATQEAILGKLRDSIKLETVSADVRDPRSGRPTEATIAFTLSFEGRNPEVVQRVTNELASLYLNENIKTRREQAAETSTFFADEADRLAKEIADFETKLAEFKQRNANSLPEQTALNMQLMDRTDREVIDLDRQISSLEERQIYLEAELAKAKSSTSLAGASQAGALTPAERLRAAEAQYLSIKSAYAPQHPDVVRLEREIAVLRNEVGGDQSRASLNEQLAIKKDELTAARGKYSDNHPDVVRLEGEVAVIEDSLAKLLPAAATANTTQLEDADNAVLVTLKSQLETVNASLRATQRQRVELQKKLAAFEQRISGAPEVERGFRTLTRDYENALAKYREIKAKQMEAQVAQQLETDRKGERFTLLEPPQLPERPLKPNRPAILFLGLVFALAAGVGVAALSEALDRGVHGPRGVIRVLQQPPLAVIPYIETAADRRRRNRHYATAAVGSVASVAVVLILINYFWMPLDVLWLALQRRVTGLIGLA